MLERIRIRNMASLCRIFIVLLLIKTVCSHGTHADGFTPQEKKFIDAYNTANDTFKPELTLDEAWFTFNSSVNFDILVFGQNQECLKCELMYLATIRGRTSKTIVVNTTFGTDIVLKRDDFGDLKTICSFSDKFHENGDYWLFFYQANYASSSCNAGLSNDPMASEMPILYVAVGLVALGIIIKLLYFCVSKRMNEKSAYEINTTTTNDIALQNMSSSTEATKEEVNTHSKRQRLKSLDIFRGISLVIMIFVNYGGGGYWFFDHPPWNGLTIADLVFPWFVFIMGTSMNYSFKSMFKRGKSRLWILRKVLTRTCLLFAFGIILNTNWGPVRLETMRIPGVLQRLSLCYLIIALLEVMFARRKDTCQDKSWAWMRDIILYIPEWILSLGILAAYLALTFALPVPGCPTGYIGPGGLHDGKKYENCTGGAAGYIDRLVLGVDHIYGNPTPKRIYQTRVSYDPEGILGTLSAIFLCFLGLQAGRIFVTYKEHKDRILRLVIWAVVTGAIGAGLCECSQNDGIIPLNKNLWSLSFSLVTASFGYILLCLLYIFVDILKWWNGTPFIYPGMNALTVYLCHDIFYRFFPVNWIIDRVHWKLLLKAVWDVTIWVVLAFVLYCKKIFIAL